LKKKVAQTSIAKRKSSKLDPNSWRYELDYWNALVLRDADYNKLADKLLETVVNDDTIFSMEVLCSKINALPRSLRRFLPKSKRLDQAYQLALQILGARRQARAEKENFYAVFSKTQHLYSDYWKESEERQAKLRTLQDNQNITKEDLNEAVSNILKSVDDESN